MFQSLRQSNIFYILQKGENPELKVGQVVSVSNPQPKYGQYVPGQNYAQNMETVVDVSVKVGEETIDFKQLPANLSIANFGMNGVVVSESREAMNAEVESMLRTSRHVIESVPFHENVISSCDVILRELNPQLAKEKQQEEKIGVLEQKVSGVENTLTDIKDMLAKALGGNSNNPKSK
ncbi:hypothetical protein [Bacteroides thetaiotaomicron]|uniref:Uncharacterized protein n=1 Tax=Bacteroides thetaiotaomicron TaxID=818 RepID=A0A943HSQ5_BACT4|nr:hypothetical protein [Bacteroides thetaiotaomicron]MBS5410800.1 hypothetical protein [Bacteroides thetaiotaomicron]MDC2233477.1 hypothetical protein [Bacteroides thetaiotaomicron]